MPNDYRASSEPGANALPIPQRVLVIGGGPTGLVALRNMIERGGFAHVELYERRDDVGGVWYFDEHQEDKADADGTPPRWPSPAYHGLIGNVLPKFLSFSGFPFPVPPSAPEQPFPTLVETHAYLQAFAAPFLRAGAIKLSREVVSVVELEDQKGWSVTSRDWTKGGAQSVEIWDAVVVSVGWYDNPVWPATVGLETLREAGLAHHAKWWRGPKIYLGKKVLVVGNANSGNDIAAQLASVSGGPVYQSIRRPAYPTFPSLPNERIIKVAPVTRYVLVPGQPPKFDAVLTDGTVLSKLDAVQIGTGYRPLPNFVHVAQSPGAPAPLPKPDDGNPRVAGLHRLIMHATNPTLGFVGAPLAHTPFTIADIASTWLALAWRGEAGYPATREERLVWEAQRLDLIASVRRKMATTSALVTYSVLGPAEQEYATELRGDIVKALPELDDVLPLWNDARTAQREAMYKTKFEALQWASVRKSQS